MASNSVYNDPSPARSLANISLNSNRYSSNKSNRPGRGAVYGSVGGYSRRLARKNFWQMFASGAALAAIAVVLLRTGALATPGRHFTLLVLGGIGAVVALYGYQTSHVAWRKAVVGYRSEARVARVLAGIGSEVILNGTLLGAGGDADHIILGPVAAVIETKTGHGHVQASTDGRIIAGGRPIPKNPVSQVNRQARALHQIAGVYVDSVVCIVDMTDRPFSVHGATVCSLADLPSVLSALPSRIGDNQARALANTLAERSKVEQLKLDAQRAARR